MIKISKIIENNNFRTIDISLSKRTYSIKITEQEIDEECKKYGINPIQQRLYASNKNLSSNLLATNIAERKLLEIFENEILGIDSKIDYSIKEASDWDSTQSHHKKLSEKLDNNDKYWGDSMKKIMFNGKYIFPQEGE